jgi:hypothetical protein
METLNTLSPKQTQSSPPISKQEFYDKIGMQTLPYPTHLSLLPLIKIIERKTGSDHPIEAQISKTLMEKIDSIPLLRQPIEDLSLLEKHQEIVEMIMLFLLSPVGKEKHLIKVMMPFSMQSVYYTPPVQSLLEENEVEVMLPNGIDKMHCANVIKACTFILNKYYGQKIEDEQLITLTVKNKETDLVRYFKTKLNLDYVEIVATKPLKPLSQHQINELMSNIYDMNLWLQYLPPENFAFHGFMTGQLIDITEEEALSRIKLHLLGQDAIVNQSSIEKLQQQLQIYFRMPDMRMGITAIDYPAERAVAHRYRIRFDFLAHKHECLLHDENANSIYEKVCKYQEVLLIEDLNSFTNKTPIEYDLLAEGIQSIIVAPLKNKKSDVIGLLEIGSPTPFQLHSFVELKFKKIVDLFAMAVDRSRNEIDNGIEAIIREKYTAVHPSVEWKFVQNAFEILENRGKEVVKDPPPIIFPDVFPLYGQADIVGSSNIRNDAIQADMYANLEYAAQTIKKCLKVIHYPLLHQQLIYLEKDMKLLQGEFSSSDESRIIELLHAEVHPLLEQIGKNHQELAGYISSYFSKLDPDLKIVYKKRKAYENSVAQINRIIGKYLEQEQLEMQKIIPHYFERYKTDGVEYDLYLGQSILRNGAFSELHLHNFRLWQMIHMCEITRIVQEVQPKLAVPLQTAQLIFAYTNSLSIRFRMDEKQFDVDGAYNVRYEILKKRIDKATINGTNERLTQAGKVAIVYLQDRDRQEYLKYIEYLLHEGYITDAVEDLEINRLQSVQGLRALRVTVKLQ